MTSPLENSLVLLQQAEKLVSADAVHRIAEDIAQAAANCIQVGGSAADTGLTLLSVEQALTTLANGIGGGKMEIQSHIAFIQRLIGGGT